ncbi:hypothetical protein BH11CYA1_BH11CYA1_21290 [soil metagenome]
MRFRSVEHAANEALIGELWPEFEALVPSDEVGLEIVFEALSLLGLIRCKCGSTSVKREEWRRTFSCIDCRAKVWFTAGTLFYRVKHFKAWLGTIFLMENGAAVASSRLSQLADIAQATAHNIQKKIRLVVESCIELEAPSLTSALFISILTKRSKSSLPCLHPDMELRTMNAETDSKNGFSKSRFEDGNAGRERESSSTEFFDLDENEKMVFDLISYTPISFNSLCELSALSVGILSSVLTMLELKGRIESQAGDFYVRSKTRYSEGASCEILTDSILALIASVNRYIWSIHHGVSFKWLQSFLAMSWFYCDKVRWNRGSLLVACLKSAPIDLDASRESQSSRQVLFPSIFCATTN